jgi:hypothetical protein
MARSEDLRGPCQYFGCCPAFLSPGPGPWRWAALGSWLGQSSLGVFSYSIGFKVL